MRKTGVVRWGAPVSFGEPPRPVPDPAVRGHTDSKTEFVFCVAGFPGQKRSHLRNPELWPPLARLVAMMRDRERPIVRPYVMPILDTGRFLGTLYWGFARALSHVRRSSHPETGNDMRGGVTSAEHRFACGFVDYGKVPADRPVSRFAGKKVDRDECEFRFLGRSDITFTWESEKQDWYPICVPLALFQGITAPPVPTEQLLDATWRQAWWIVCTRIASAGLITSFLGQGSMA